MAQESEAKKAAEIFPGGLLESWGPVAYTFRTLVLGARQRAALRMLAELRGLALVG